eukprot:TRINITY_DN1269_c0_g1::TRINITY_DN1269_c0_g1_i1::g.26771::m.26771 TRINITY_DN1269_c0_g1::TRINITY_DN1269_c0_g1_i1::g.26771  ORF type:complete len:284 (-),score=54.90,DZR/PF12773.2/26,DZR/PF12773.2/6.3e-05,zf-ribbon_3/PF13248.1/67,zf-ribbon_3/PF13248.1/2.9e-05,zinc_ribbon_2/PF13240.1/5.9e+02,zinc_ribbon_2/PF13240.1/0.00014,HypA/PF01155.14/52,HypA/PF01155.14/0.24,zf-RanBP/PF00641.13/6.5e+02,zf-RanBP/PF00641.13/0.0043,T4_baseplate/PF12322.3/8.8e+02,T4_baseplate/PF12322.3/0.18,T4_baseplate/PF12322.3/7.4
MLAIRCLLVALAVCSLQPVHGGAFKDALAEVMSAVTGAVVKPKIEDIVVDVIDNMNFTVIGDAISAMNIPEVYLDATIMGDVTVDVNVTNANSTYLNVVIDGTDQNFGIGVNSKKEQAYQINMTCETCGEMKVKLTHEITPLEVEFKSPKSPMEVNINVTHIPMAVDITTKVTPFDISLNSEEATFNVTLESVQTTFVSWILLSVLILLQAGTLAFMWWQSRTITSLEALAHSYVSEDGTVFCPECGAKNSLKASYCYSCGRRNPGWT